MKTLIKLTLASVLALGTAVGGVVVTRKILAANR